LNSISDSILAFNLIRYLKGQSPAAFILRGLTQEDYDRQKDFEKRVAQKLFPGAYQRVCDKFGESSRFGLNPAFFTEPVDKNEVMVFGAEGVVDPDRMTGPNDDDIFDPDATEKVSSDESRHGGNRGDPSINGWIRIELRNGKGMVGLKIKIPVLPRSSTENQNSYLSI
jgi:hypothetical protein